MGVLLFYIFGLFENVVVYIYWIMVFRYIVYYKVVNSKDWIVYLCVVI